MLVVESTKKVKNIRPKLEVEEMVKKLQKEYEKPVKGKFDFIEAKGGVFSFSDRQFPGTPITTYHLRHDETCIIPKGVAKRLNNTIQKVRRQKTEMAESGTVRGVPSTYEQFSRVRFIPEDYL